MADHEELVQFSHSLKQAPTFNDNNTLEQVKDYLQDPSLWRDPLPQPYRLLDEILSEILSKIFQIIQEKDKEEEYRRKHDKNIPKSDDGIIMSSLLGATRLEHIKISDKEYLVAGGTSPQGITCIELTSKKCFSNPVEGPVNSISAQTLSDEYIILAVGMKQYGGSLLVCDHSGTFNTLYKLEGPDFVQSVLLSKNGNLLAVTGWVNSSNDEENESSCQIFLYSLPTESWIQQIQTEQDNFSKPTCLFTIPSPLPLTPSPNIDNNQTIKLHDRLPSLPTGSSHCLTKTYLESRRNRFVSLRKGFIAQNGELSYSLMNEGGADLSFIHYWKREYFVSPKVLAVKWERSTQLHLYVIQEKNKVATLTTPDQVYLQPSLITCAVVSSNSSFLATGTDQGILALTDLSTNLLWGVVDLKSSLMALCFVKTGSDDVVMMGGCEDGSVKCVKWDGPSNYHVTCLTKGYSVPSPVHELKCNESLPPTVTSLHDDKCVIVWDWLECVPLVSLPFPSSYCLLSNPKGTLVTGSCDLVAVIAKTTNDINEEQIGVFSWQLSTCEALRKTFLVKDELTTGSNESGKSKEVTNVYDELTNMLSQTVQLTI